MSIFQQFFEWGLHLPPTGLYLFIFAWLFIESTGFPISDEYLLLPMGYLATTGKLNLALVIFVALVGKVSASYVAFLIGHVVKLERLARPDQRPANGIGKYLFYIRPTMAQVIATEERVRKNGPWGVFLGRLVPVVRSFISYPAGAARMPHGIFLIATTAGSLLWIGIWTITGAIVGKSYEQVKAKLGTVSIVLLAAAAVVVILILVWNHRRAESAALRLQAERIAAAAKQARDRLPHRHQGQVPAKAASLKGILPANDPDTTEKRTPSAPHSTSPAKRSPSAKRPTR